MMACRSLPLPLLLCALFSGLTSIDAFAPPFQTQVLSLSFPSARFSHKQQSSERLSSDDDDIQEELHAAAATLPPSISTSTRREALVQSAKSIAVSFAAQSSLTAAASAASPPVTLPSTSTSTSASNSASNYQPAKRCFAYLVDQTIPPSLIPYRAQREAAILKNLGMGSGTPKSPFIEDELNLNNFMNKAVVGSFSAAKELVLGNPNGKPKKDQSFVFLGTTTYTAGNDNSLGNDSNYNELKEDVNLAVSLLTDICKPREREGNTAIGLAFAPQSSQASLDAYLTSKTNNEDANANANADSTQLLVDALIQSGANPKVVNSHLPIFKFAKSKRFPLLALAPESADLETVYKGGLQSLDPLKRENYVADAQGFIALTQDPKFKMYTEKSLLKDFKPSSNVNNANNSGNNQDAATATAEQGNFFAQRILVHEACATAISKWAVSRPNSLVVALAPIQDVRFMGGINGRVPRICNFLTNGESLVDEEAVTTILLNPSAKETLSESKFIRLEIGTAPEYWAIQTKVADYLWFSTMPKVNMLPRMMNEQ